MTLSITILDAECHIFIVMLIPVLLSVLAADEQLTCRSVHKMNVLLSQTGCSACFGCCLPWLEVVFVCTGNTNLK